MPMRRRDLLPAAAGLAFASSARPASAARLAADAVRPPGGRLPLLQPPRLRPGDTVALVNPSGAIYEREPYERAAENLRALGLQVREAPRLRARYGHLAGTDAQRASDINAMFADPTVQGILAVTGGSGGGRILPLIDYALARRNPKFLGGFSDLTALLNAVHRHTGLVTFHSPMAASEWNAFSVEHFRAVAMQGEAVLMRNPASKEDALAPRQHRIRTLRGGRAQGPLVGGNLAVLAAISGSAYWPVFEGGILFLEEINEYIYRVDRMLSTLQLAGALDGLAGVVLGAFTNCGPGDGNFGTLTLDEVFDDYFGALGVPVYRGASFGHIPLKFTLPIGVTAEIDADAGTLRLLQPATL